MCKIYAFEYSSGHFSSPPLANSTSPPFRCSFWGRVCHRSGCAGAACTNLVFRARCLRTHSCGHACVCLDLSFVFQEFATCWSIFLGVRRFRVVWMFCVYDVLVSVLDVWGAKTYIYIYLHITKPSYFLRFSIVESVVIVLTVSVSSLCAPFSISPMVSLFPSVPPSNNNKQ